VNAGGGTGGSIGAVGGIGGAPGSAGAVSQTGGAGGGGGAATGDGVRACEQLTTTLCATGVQCVAGTNQASCQSQLRLELDCDLATGMDFSTCSRDAQAGTCSDLYPQGGLTVPDTCLAPITSTPLSDAQTKCYEFVDALCSHTLACAGLAASSPSDVQDCEDDVATSLQVGLPCLLATAVGPDYASCIAAIATLPCVTPGADGGGISMPAVPSPSPSPSCANALIFRP